MSKFTYLDDVKRWLVTDNIIHQRASMGKQLEITKRREFVFAKHRTYFLSPLGGERMSRSDR